MSPIKIEILLHYYAKGDDYRAGDFSAPAVRDAIDQFLVGGMLQKRVRDGDREPRRMYDLDERGEVYVKALLEVPWPVKRWVMPE